MNSLPEELKLPAGGLSCAEEPDDLKGARVLAALRHLVRSDDGTLGMMFEGQGIMLVKYRPQPDGPHRPGADLSGTEL